MEINTAISRLAALAQEHRLTIFRLLVTQGPEGLPAGDIGERVGISATSASFHLKELDRAGLIGAKRDGRFIRYAFRAQAMNELLAFLTEDCCQGHPELCGGMFVNSRKDVGEDRTMSEAVYNVLFLCTHNSARSVIAECIINRLGAGKFCGYSAGSAPRGSIHPYALDMLRNQNYEISGLRSKSWDEFVVHGAPKMDFVFTVCDDAASEVCPIWPGQPMTAHWGIPDPSAAAGSEAEKRYAFADTHRMLYQRIGILVSLPLASLDALALQKQLRDIGRTHSCASESEKA